MPRIVRLREGPGSGVAEGALPSAHSHLVALPAATPRNEETKMSDRRDGPAAGDVVGDGGVHAYSWEWSEVGGPRARSRLPWFGIFLLVFGGLLLLEKGIPALATAGSLLFLAVGLAFLVSWLANRGVGSLYLGSIITALAAPDLLSAFGVNAGSGVGTLCLGIAFLFIALVRAASGNGYGWQAGLGLLLSVIGASSVAIPGFGDLLWPLVLVVLGVLLLVRSTAGAKPARR